MNPYNKSLSGISTINDFSTNNIDATTGTITTLDSTTSTIETLNSTTSTISTLNSTTGTIATLNSTTGTIATLNSTTGTITTLDTSSITSSGDINITNSSSSYQINGVSLLSTATGSNGDIFGTIPSCMVTKQLLVGNTYGNPQVGISYDTTTTSPCIFGITENVGSDPIQIGNSGLGGCSLNILNGSLLMDSGSVIDGSRNIICNSINQASTTGSSCGYINGLTSASTTISASNTWIIPSGTFTSTFSKNATVLSTGCGYTINGSVTQYYMVKCDCSVNGTSGTNLSIGLSVNSATPSPINTISITGATYQPISVSGVLSLASAETIQLMINNLSNTDSVTINQINFSIVPCNFI